VLDFTVAEIRRIQSAYRRDAFGLLGGASLFSEKGYLVDKFARVALKARHVDYNGRLCVVSAAGANKLSFGIGRAGNPFRDILETDCLLIAGSNVDECFLVMPQCLWGARYRGAKVILVALRETAVDRTADVHVALAGEHVKVAPGSGTAAQAPARGAITTPSVRPCSAAGSS
jgi:assimilatory nitrate reductase catalytic subunit